MKQLNEVKIGVIGLGYVGLPLAVAYSSKYPTIGFDLKQSRVDELNRYYDNTGESSEAELKQSIEHNGLTLSCEETVLDNCNVYIVTVPTPIDACNVPDLRPLFSASRTIGKHISKGDIVIYESTTFPTCTRNYCAPLIEQESGLTFNQDFYCGYSPERINPADPTNKLLNIKKITSGSTPEVALFVDNLYNSILLNGTHKAPSMEVAELAKAIENAQRDTNIAFINEIAVLCNAIGIDTQDVIEAAGSKWNFHKYQPGLVGGHCISVDPYYIQYIAESYGITTQVINAARRTNNAMADFVATNVIKMLAQNNKPVTGSKVLVMGCTFKENCPDIRNSKVFDIIHILQKYNVDISILDPHAINSQLPKELQPLHVTSLRSKDSVGKKEELMRYDAILICVKHQLFLKDFEESNILADCSAPLIYDLKHLLNEYKGEINDVVRSKSLTL